MTASALVAAAARPRAQRRPHRRPLSAGRFAIYIVLTALAVFSLGPIVVFTLNGLKTQADLASNPLGLPAEWRWGNYVTAWQQANMAVGLGNSLILVAGTALGVCVISGAAAYAMARLRIKGSGALIVYLLVTSALPIQLFLVPLFYTWTKVGLYDTLFGLIVIYWGVFSPFATLLLRSFMVGIPKEYEEAARLDGANELRVLSAVIVPMAWPGFLTAALVAGLSAYNEFILAVTFLQSEDRMPISISFFSFQQGYTSDYTLVSAAGFIMLLPMLLVFLLLQRRFIEGYSSSGMTG
jgi:raffinose/stachyose/melibiose transport system permease protein